MHQENTTKTKRRSLKRVDYPGIAMADPHDHFKLTPKRRVMPLKHAVCYITFEADPHDQQSIQKAVRAWHNRLSNGTVPRSIFVKIGKSLFIDIFRFETWVGQGGSSNRE